MHESQLARQMLDAVLARARAERVERVRAVDGWIAETEALSPESLELHFASHARGTAADGAELRLRLIEVRARCAGCGAEYLPDHHVTLCPECGATEATLLGTTGMGIETMEVDER